MFQMIKYVRIKTILLLLKSDQWLAEHHKERMLTKMENLNYELLFDSDSQIEMTDFWLSHR